MQQILQDSIKALKNAETILYPTDTVWGIGCDATNEKAVSKIFAIKNRAESKSVVVLVSSVRMLKEYIGTLSSKAIRIQKTIDRPVTIIYNNPKRLARNIIAKDNTVAIRIVKDNYCKKMIRIFGKPIVSTSANISGKPTPKSFREIEPSILDAVDYVVNLQQDRECGSPSMIIKLTNNGVLEVIRK